LVLIINVINCKVLRQLSCWWHYNLNICNSIA